MVTARIAGTAAAFIVMAGLALPAAAQTTTAPTTSRSERAEEPSAPEAEPRPPALSPLYGTFIALQVLDIDSTLKGARSGKTEEWNPMIGRMASSPAALITFKAATTAGVIVVCERLRKQHHGTAALLVMIGLNSAYVAVVAHNYALLHQ